MVEERDSNPNGHEEATLALVKILFNTSDERLPELTNIPLDQVRPLSMMATSLKELDMLCDDIKEAQYWFTFNYQKVNGSTTDDPKDDPAYVDPDTHKEFKIDSKKRTALMKEWIHSYLQFRRSVGGEFVKHGVVLAQDQMASQQQEPMSADQVIERIRTQ